MRWAVIVLFGIFLFSFASALDIDDCDNNMVAYWQFEDDLSDGYGSHDEGIWEGVAAYGGLSVGGAALFGGNSNVSIDDATGLRFISSFTIEMWAKASSSGVLFKKGDYKIELTKEGTFPVVNKIRLSVGSVVLDSGAIDINASHYIGVVWNSTSDNLSLYVDGVVVSGVLTGAKDATEDLVLGYGFNGLIDELAIYNRTLSASEIGLHRGLTSTGKTYCDLSGAEGSSSTRTDFNVNGCTFVGIGGVEIGVTRGRCSGGVNYGMFYCDDDLYNWTTSEEGLGCAMGNSEYDTTNNDSFCCPHGSFCNETGPDMGIFRCNLRPVNCIDQKTKTDCNAVDVGCIWFDGVCVEGLGDYDCGYYENGDTEEVDNCRDDRFNLSKIGIGTEECGTTFECNGEQFVISEDKCSCEWYDSAEVGKKCQVKLIANQVFHATGVEPDGFGCSRAYELGPCEGGQQPIEWTAQVPTEDLKGWFADVAIDPAAAVALEACLAAIGCQDDSGIRSCGEPIIKLPGFSLFALFASLFIIGTYYYFRE